MPTPSSLLKAVRGTRDLLPPETALWNHVESVARSVFSRYGFGEIRTPIFEATELFARGVGEETDIVSKEMYTWPDRDRFDYASFRSAWKETSASLGYGQFEENIKVGSRQVDMIAKLPIPFEGENAVLTNLIEFKSEIRGADVDQLASLVAQYEPSSHERRVMGTLVVPDQVSLPPGITELAQSLNVQIQPLSGEFFQQSQRLTLRPENTAGVVRAYIEHKLSERGDLQKLFYIGPQFRRERPQRGRYRQFWQIGAEVLGPVSSGAESPIRDAEVLEMLATLLDELGIRNWQLQLNSVGSSEDRQRYNAALREALAPIRHQLCEDNQRRAETNPLRVLDSKDPNDQVLIDGLPKIADYLDESSRAHFAQVLTALDSSGVPYTINPRLVRGLDYYTRTTFEFTVPDGQGLGTQNALLGGGRYDGLSEMLGGPKAPGIGFAIGEDRLILTLQAQMEANQSGAPHLDSEMWAAKKLDAYIAPMGVERNPAALALARELRRAGLSVEVGDGSFRLKKSFDVADKVARHIVILGEDELATGILTVKTFSTGEQKKIPKAELPQHLHLEER